jgi:hypothetical protein
MIGWRLVAMSGPAGGNSGLHGGKACEENGWAVGKFCDELEAPSHGFHVAAQRPRVRYSTAGTATRRRSSIACRTAGVTATARTLSSPSGSRQRSPLLQGAWMVGSTSSKNLIADLLSRPRG